MFKYRSLLFKIKTVCPARYMVSGTRQCCVMIAEASPHTYLDYRPDDHRVRVT